MIDSKLLPKDFLPYVTKIDRDWGAGNGYTNISGIEHFTNLKELVGEQCISVIDISPINNLLELQHLDIMISNQSNLDDLKNLSKLNSVRIWTEPFGIRTYEKHDETDLKEKFTKNAIVDISALSNAKELKSININTYGIMSPITLKKETSSFELFDPIILSTQFDGIPVLYRSGTNEDFESSDTLKWDNLTGKEEYLPFSVGIGRKPYWFNGAIQIPVRWK